jgi:hypothetical protein
MYKKIIGILLIVTALLLGYQGIQKLDNSSASLEIGELEIAAKDQSSQTTGFIYLGGAALLLLGGVVITKRS